MFLTEMGGPRWVIMGMVVKLAQSVSVSRRILLTFLPATGSRSTMEGCRGNSSQSRLVLRSH